MGWIGCIRCEKFRHDFVAWTFALIAPVQPIMHQVSCSNEMVPNAPKHYETQQKLSLGSNGVDQVRSLRKLPTQLCGTNFCIVQHILHWVYFVALSLGSNGVDWVRCCKNIRRNFVARTFALIAPVQTILHWVYFVALSLGSNGVDWVRSLWKHPTWLCGTNFCINHTSSAHFAPSFVQ